MKKIKINKKGIIISLVMIVITGCIGYKVLGSEEEIPDEVFEKLFLFESYIPEEEITETSSINRIQEENWNLYNNSIYEKRLASNYVNKLKSNSKDKLELKNNINAYYNTINAIDYFSTELHDNNNEKLRDEIFTLVEDYIYNSRMGNIEDIKLDISDDIKESLIDFKGFIKDNKIKIYDIGFDRENYDLTYFYLANSLPIEVRVSYSYEIKDKKELLLGSSEYNVYLDLTEETLYSDWKENKKNKDYKLKVIGVNEYKSTYDI